MRISLTRKQLVTIGLCTLILFGSFGIGAYAFTDKDADLKNEIAETKLRIENRSQEWAETQPKAQRERAHCATADTLEAQLKELNVMNNLDKKHLTFLESLVDPDPQ